MTLAISPCVLRRSLTTRMRSPRCPP